MQPWMNRCFLKMTISSEITSYYNNYILKKTKEYFKINFDPIYY